MARVRIRRLPAERLKSLAVVGSVCCSSCCCCCCCLHSVGGLVGAAAGSVWAVAPSKDDARDGATISVLLHWTIVVALSIAAFVTGSLTDDENGIWIGLAAVVLGIPAFQLTALLIGLMLVPFTPVPDKGASLKALGKLALISLLGTLLGGALLVVVVVLFVAAS